MEDWYRIRVSDVSEHGGSSLMHQFGSLYNVLSLVYSEHDWKPWKFGRMPKHYVKEHSKIMIDSIAKELGNECKFCSRFYETKEIALVPKTTANFTLIS